jgi:hypothetical protein
MVLLGYQLALHSTEADAAECFAGRFVVPSYHVPNNRAGAVGGSAALDAPRWRCGLTVFGMSPVDAGPKNALAVPRTAYSGASSHTCALPLISSTPIVPWLTSRTTSAVSITSAAAIDRQ